MTQPTPRQRLHGLAATLLILLLLAGVPFLLIAIGAAPGHTTLGDLRTLLSAPDDGTLAMVLIAATPFLAMGLCIGYLLSSKAAVAVAQVLNFPLAFIGGLMLPPEMFPGWLDVVSLATPARAARDIVIWALTGEQMPGSTLPVLLGWTVALTALAVWANRRDEGRRFR